MKYLFLFLIPLLSFSSVLEDRVYSKAQTACYLKNSSNGLSASDYSPVVSSQSFRNSNEQDYYSVDDANEICNSWNLDPYVNVDTELYGVVAEMSCSVTEYDDNGQTKWKSKVDIYNLTIDCNVACEVPRKSNGDIYDKYDDFDASQCTVGNIQILLNTYYGDNNYIADDAQYLSCTDTPSLTSCYFDYHINLDIDNNTIDNNTSDANNSGIIDSIDKMNYDTSSNLNSLNKSLSGLREQIYQDNDTRRRQLDRIIEETNRTANITGTNMITLYDINYTLNESKTLLEKQLDFFEDINSTMNSELNNTDINTSIGEAKVQAQLAIASLTSSLNQIISSYTGTVPIITGTGTHVFTASVYDGSVTFDLSMFERLRSSFDILWLLLLAYINFKIYSVIIRDLLKKI